MSKEGGEDAIGTPLPPLTRADIPELFKAVADALTQGDTPEDTGGPAEAGGSKSGGKCCPPHANWLSLVY